MIFEPTDPKLMETGKLLNMDSGAAAELARKFAREIEENMQYAHQVKVPDWQVKGRRILESG